MNHRIVLSLFVGTALFLSGCDVTGRGQLQIMHPEHFRSGGTERHGIPTDAPRSPSRGTYLAKIRIEGGEDGNSARLWLSLPGFGTTRISSLGKLSCVPLPGGRRRCTAEDPSDTTRNGPLKYIAEIEGDTLINMAIWELKPSSHRVYIEEERVDRGPVMIAFFGHSEHTHRWPPAAAASVPDDSGEFRRVLAELSRSHGPQNSGRVRQADRSSRPLVENPASPSGPPAPTGRDSRAGSAD